MRVGRHQSIRASVVAFWLAVTIVLSPQVVPAKSIESVKTSDFQSEVLSFLDKELAAHLGAISSVNPPPDRILGVPTTGEFSWARSCVRSQRMRIRAASVSSLEETYRSGSVKSGWLKRTGSKAFSQLYAALALRHFGRDLKTNPLWLSLSPEEQKAWRSLLNPERFYDPKTNRVIELPDNYLGVAARIASISYEAGISTDRAFLDRFLTVLPFNSPVERFLRMTHHQLVDTIAIPTSTHATSGKQLRWLVEKTSWKRCRPSLKTQMHLWWDLVSEDGYGYNWGRSQGLVSYLDTPEITAFLLTRRVSTCIAN